MLGAQREARRVVVESPAPSDPHRGEAPASPPAPRPEDLAVLTRPGTGLLRGRSRPYAGRDSRQAGCRVGVPIPPSAIRTPAEKLDAALKAVGTKDAQLVTALAGRDNLFDEAETDEPRVRAVLDALLRYARLDAVADRLARPVGAPRAPSAEEPSPEPLPDATPTK